MPAEKKRVSSRTPRVLVIDDFADNREMYAEYLRFDGFIAITAINGEDGLRKALADPPDVIVLDLFMPRMDGWELARALKTDARTKNIPVIVLTGRAPQTQAQRVPEVEVAAYLMKPLLPEQLAHEIRRHLRPAKSA